MCKTLNSLQEKEKVREEKLKEQAEKLRLKQLEKEQKRNAEIEYELNKKIIFKL